MVEVARSVPHFGPRLHLRGTQGLSRETPACWRSLRLEGDADALSTVAPRGSSDAHAVSTTALGLVEFFVCGLEELGTTQITCELGAANGDGDGDRLSLKHELVRCDAFPQGLGELLCSLERCFWKDEGELLAPIAGEDFVFANAVSHDARQLSQDVVARQVSVAVVDGLEMIDVEHERAKIPFMAAGSHDVSFECFLEITLIVDLCETINDGHSVDLFVVFCLGVGTREELEDCRSNLDPVAVAQLLFSWDLLFVDVGSIGASVVDHEPTSTLSQIEVRVTSADAVPFENNMVIRPSADADRRAVENEAFAEEGSLGCVNHDKTIRSTAVARLIRLHHFGDACLFVLIVQ